MKKALKIISSLAISGVFLWLAFKNVELKDIIEASRHMSWGWLVPFSVVTMFSHFIRAERWRMLFMDKSKVPTRLTLLTGVMFGYLTNIALPRVGEVTRPIYVARQVGESNSKLIGTIVLERLVDLVSMLLIMVFVAIFLISDPEILTRLFGIDFTDHKVYVSMLKWGAIYTSIALVVGFLLYKLVDKLSKEEGPIGGFINKIRVFSRKFLEGVLSIRQLKNWPLFVLYTALIWLAYITMTYIPFWMFDMQIQFDLSFADAVVLTMVSAVGLAIPTPGGMGSYHLFITYTLSTLYAVPEVTGLAFATIAHASTLVMYIIVSPILLAVDKYYSLKREARKQEH